MNINRTWKYQWKWTLGSDLVRVVDLPVRAPVETEWLSIGATSDGKAQITVRKGYSWDGCSIVPDAPRSKWASCCHDACYQYADALALAWGISQGAALAWADKAFLQIMRQDKCPVAGLYYAGVRVLGRPYRFFSSLFSG